MSNTISVDHLGTDPDFLALYGEPDYDYLALVVADVPSLAIVDDPEGMLGSHDEGTFNFAQGKEGTLYLPLVDIDIDIDSDNDDGRVPMTRATDQSSGQ